MQHVHTARGGLDLHSTSTGCAANLAVRVSLVWGRRERPLPPSPSTLAARSLRLVPRLFSWTVPRDPLRPHAATLAPRPHSSSFFLQPAPPPHFRTGDRRSPMGFSRALRLGTVAWRLSGDLGQDADGQPYDRRFSTTPLVRLNIALTRHDVQVSRPAGRRTRLPSQQKTGRAYGPTQSSPVHRPR